MILVIGGTGTTGRLVTGRLIELGRPVRVASRREAEGDVRFDWYDPATHEPALAGVDAIYLLAPVAELDPAPIVEPFLERAVRAGARRVVLLSSSAIEPGERGLGQVAALAGELFAEWTVLRPSWFMENFVGRHPHAVSVRERGEIVSATGSGRVGFVDPADIAEVAVRALTDPTPHNVDHVITGPETLSYAEVAAVLAEVGGRSIRHRAVSVSELTERLAASGLPFEFARFLAGLDAAIAAGAEDRTTSVVETVTGRAPRAFRDFCADRLGRPSASVAS